MLKETTIPGSNYTTEPQQQEQSDIDTKTDMQTNAIE
jgi:hypothetical protein